MIQCYTQFCQTYFKDCPPFPSSLIMLSQFIAYLSIRNYSPSSIASYISAISFVHKSNNLTDPTNSFLIKKILKGAHNLKGRKDVRLPITKDILIKLMNALPFVIQNVDNQLLLISMFALAFYAFLRIGEITTKNHLNGSKVLQVSNVSFNAEDNDINGLSVVFTNYKHSDLHAKTIVIPLEIGNAACPGKAVHNYLSTFSHTKDSLFQFHCGSPVTH